MSSLVADRTHANSRLDESPVASSVAFVHDDGMRGLVVVLVVSVILPTAARAQRLTAAAITGGIDATNSVWLDQSRLEQSSAQTSYGSRPVHYCCHLKGFLIGAAVGVATGATLAWLSNRYLCEYGCSYAKPMLFFGGIGAGLGAFFGERYMIPVRPPEKPPRVQSQSQKSLTNISGS